MSGSRAEVLQKTLREKFPNAHRFELKGGKGLDEPVSISFGGVNEVVVDPAVNGGNLVLYHLLKCSQGRQVALLDAMNRFNPRDYFGVCETLLWLRFQQGQDIWKITDWLLKDGNMEVVILDVRDLPKAEEMSRRLWYRLRTHVEASGSGIVVLSSQAQVPCAGKRWMMEDLVNLASLEKPRADLMRADVFAVN